MDTEELNDGSVIVNCGDFFHGSYKRVFICLKDVPLPEEHPLNVEDRLIYFHFAENDLYDYATAHYPVPKSFLKGVEPNYIIE